MVICSSRSKIAPCFLLEKESKAKKTFHFLLEKRKFAKKTNRGLDPSFFNLRHAPLVAKFKKKKARKKNQ